MTINYTDLQNKVIDLAAKYGKEAVEKFLTAAASELLKSAGISLPAAVEKKQLTDKTEKTAKVVATKKPAADVEDAEVVEEPQKKVIKKSVKEEAPAESGKRVRATNAEMLERSKKALAEAKEAGAKKDKLAELLAAVDKFAAKVAASKTATAKKVAEEPKTEEVSEEEETESEEEAEEEAEEEEETEEEAEEEEETEDAVEEEEQPKKKTAPAKKEAAPVKKASAPAKKAKKWDGTCGGVEVTKGAAIYLTSETFQDEEGVSVPMKYRVVEVDVEGSMVKVFPADLNGEPNAEGKLPATEEESAFSADWEEVAADGSNIKMVKKIVKKGGL